MSKVGPSSASLDYSSEEELEVSESEIDDYTKRIYDQLKNGKHKVKYSDLSFRCPFCPGKKKQDFQYKDLLQHATGVGASNRKAKEKGNHLALAKYMKIELADAGDTSQPTVKLEHITTEGSENLFVWPWMGILVNLPTERKDGKQVGKSPSELKQKLAKFHPLKVHALWNFRGHSGSGIIDFSKDWQGFKDAMSFEMEFKANHLGREDWIEKNSGPNMYGWVAGAEDYNAVGLIADHLRKNGDLKTILDIQRDESRRNEKLVQNLANEIDSKVKQMKELECKYNETNISLSKMIEEKDRLQQTYNDELRKMQMIARDHTQRIIKENEMLKSGLESQGKELESRRREMEKLHAEDGYDEIKLIDEKKKRVHLATLEQQKVDQNVLRLIEEHKKEKEEYLKTKLQLEKQMDAKHALELEIGILKGKLEVGKHIQGDDDGGKKKVKEMMDELEEKVGELSYFESLNQTLIVKERKSNDELQDARKEFIEGLMDILPPRGRTIGIKRMGELNVIPFKDACEEKYAGDDAGIKASEVISLWEEQLRNPEWHPFKILSCGDEVEEIVNEDDEKLKALRTEWGDAAYDAVTIASKEMNEYNPSGRYPIPELWNLKENRKATLKEVVNYVLKEWKPPKTTKRRRQW